MESFERIYAKGELVINLPYVKGYVKLADQHEVYLVDSDIYNGLYCIQSIELKFIKRINKKQEMLHS